MSDRYNPDPLGARVNPHHGGLHRKLMLSHPSVAAAALGILCVVLVSILWLQVDAEGVAHVSQLAGGFLLILIVLLVGGLTQSFHTMRSSLEQARRKQHHAETELSTRTQEIEETNRALTKVCAEAKAAARSKTEFLANMSHEIRTPMTAIMGYTDILVENVLNHENVEAAEIVKRNADYLLTLLDDILDLSKIEAGKLSIENMKCSLCNLVAEVASLMRVRAEAKGIPLDVRYEGKIPETIQSDPTRLRQILINLLGNAIKFTEVGKVSLVVRLLNEQHSTPKLQFEVIDTGIGMTNENLARLFRPFTQADNSTTRRFGGTGLGLTISKRLAEMLGGTITVSSSDGVGSTFSVIIEAGSLDKVKMLDRPSVEFKTEKRHAKPKVEALKPQPILDRRVLLVEDGPDNQRLLSFVLKKAGAHVTLAENGKIGVDLALGSLFHRRHGDPKEPFDVILMDMQMPILDGYNATKLLREQGYTRPIIALTAHAMPGDREKCIEAGCDDFATKPIEREKLIGLVAKYSSQQHSEAQPVQT
jgi:signal transduction histidine kinase/ActR/RegA family two-component response regulator